jgi:hypothetical protein
MTLVGFLRGETMNVYTGAARVAAGTSATSATSAEMAPMR